MTYRTIATVRARPRSLAALLLVGLVGLAAPAGAQATGPGFWEPNAQLSKPDLSALPRLRFLTAGDFFPFNYLDESGTPAGFHVDLARAICDRLDMTERCQIQVLPWEELEPALQNRQGEAIIAGIAVNQQSRQRYLFSRSYMQFPARLVTRREAPVGEPLHRALSGKRVGVAGGTAHAALLRALFPEAQAVVYGRTGWLYQDLMAGRIDALFGDGMRLSFWLAGADADDCCVFSGGPYLAPGFLGHGLAVAVRRNQPALVQAIDFALQEIEASGLFSELYLRYFPVGFY